MSSPHFSGAAAAAASASSSSTDGSSSSFSLASTSNTNMTGRANTTPQRLLRLHLAHERAQMDSGGRQESRYHEIPPNHFLAQQRSHAAAGPSAHSKSDSSATSSSHTPTRTHRRSPSSLSDGGESMLLSPFSEQQVRHLPDGLLHDGLPAGPASASLVVGGHRATSIPDTSTLAAADFDIDVRSGFLPPEEPVRRLDGIEGEVWETALERAIAIPLRKGGGGSAVTSENKRAARQWRRAIRNMLVLHPSPQLRDDVRYARRGHVVLSFLAHFYIHSQPEPVVKNTAPSWNGWMKKKSDVPADEEDLQDERDEENGKFVGRLPASLAVPWLALSAQLDIPPVLTYADTVLWNWHLKDPRAGFNADNVAITTTFTNTLSESHFFLTSLLIELRGVEALTLMRRSLDEAFVADTVARRRVAHYLRRLAHVVDALSVLLAEVRIDCDPKVFYWGIRPWFNGGDSAPPNAKGQRGWHFEGVDADDERRLFTGPSAGQSSLIHSIDVFLDVDHTRRKPRVGRRGVPAVTPATSTNALPDDATFMERMQLYMPGHHRRFLTHLRDLSFDEVEDRPRPVANEELHKGKGKGVDKDEAMEVDDEEDVNMDEAIEEEEEEPYIPSHPIRSLAMADEDHRGRPLPANDGLRAAYDTALRSLKHLRDEHMRVATLYIVSQARTAPPSEYALLSDLLTQKKMKSDDEDESSGGPKGTGGTELVSFLKQCRTNTLEALLGE